MNDELKSILIGTSGLAILATIAVWLTLTFSSQSRTSKKVVKVLLLTTGCQGLHFLEEYFTGFYILFPTFLGLAPWRAGFFVVFNLAWIVIWLVSAIGIHRQFQAAYFPAWFLALAAILNGIAHPLLAIVTGGYFPGLISSPILGVLGWRLLAELRLASNGAQDCQ